MEGPGSRTVENHCTGEFVCTHYDLSPKFCVWHLEDVVKVNLSICSALFYTLSVITITSQVGMSSNVCENVLDYDFHLWLLSVLSHLWKNNSTLDRAARDKMAALSSASDVRAGPRFPNL